MGRGRGKFSIGREKWVACSVFLILMGVIHWTASNSTYLANSFALFRGWSHQAILAYTTINEDQQQNPRNQVLDLDLPTLVEPVDLSPRSEDQKAAPRVAICLVGGARAFELTGLTIKKHVLDVYDHPDIFLHVPVDGNTHKLTLLQNASNLAMARAFVPAHIQENPIQQELLTAANSPNGIQGLLQYFSLVEGCLDMISWFEIKHRFTYDWIIRTRVDGYWNGPLPPISSFNPKHYHVPYGSSFGGFNDRLGVGTRHTSWAALSRMRLIPKVHEFGYRSLNSENSFRAQLAVENITVERGEYTFCILSARKYAWPLGRWGVPVFSIKSRGNLNGAKCRPCNPVATGEHAVELLSVLDPGWGWTGPVHDVQLCDASQEEIPGWEEIFDEVADLELGLARKKITNRTEGECIKDVREFGKLWELWDAPSAEDLCSSSVK